MLNRLRNYIPSSWKNNVVHLPQAFAANVYYGWPSKNLDVIGVTGTDGKTTTTTGIYHILNEAKKKAGMISTVKAAFEGNEVDTGFHVTTPDAWSVQKLLKEMMEKRLDFLVLESTSHGLAQNRLWGIEFDIGVVTNITHEHLDYHGNYENYLKAKAKLFNSVKYAVLNRDDSSFEKLKKYIEEHNLKAKIVSYGVGTDANIRGSDMKLTDKGVSFTYEGKVGGEKRSGKIYLPLYGAYNMMNALAMISAAICLRISDKDIVQALKTFPGIPGRMEVMQEKPFTAIVDFAHTPNALESALKAVKEHFLSQKPTSSFRPARNQGGRRHSDSGQAGKTRRIFAVYGCAGLRDVEKRFLMGEVSGRLAEVSVLTAEDPRTEDVNQIIEMMAKGCVKGGAKEIKDAKALEKNKSSRVFIRIPDRREAIAWAVENANVGDTVGAFGKGHEQSMCFGTVEYPWSDQETMKTALKNR